MPKRTLSALAFALCLAAGTVRAEEAAPLSALAKMPVKEITVFKDGHAFVLHEGRLATDRDGNVQMDYLPTPVIGTFWPYSADKRVKLAAVTASQRKVQIEHTALTLRDLLEANPGAQVSLQEVSGSAYNAQIVGVPTRSSEELETTSPPNSGERLPEKGGVLLVKTAEGVSVVNFDRILTATFKGDYKRALRGEEFRNLLTLKLDWPNNKAAKTADVGMVYLQKGVRWIPSYKIALDGKGNAAVKLQATLINEMTDLDDVTTNLVIGVPAFFFQETPDPISLQQTFGQLSPYFQTNSQTSYAFSNAMATQAMGRATERLGGIAGPSGPGGPVDLGPEVAGSGKSEDLFVFTVKHITLKKGQRMVFPVAETTLKYRDIFAVDLPFAPPPEFRGNFNSEQIAEIARLMSLPKAIHKIRLINKSDAPLTTAPALILSGDRVLAQAMMTYTSIGGEAALALTTATDIQIKKTEKETQRTPNAIRWQDYPLTRLDLAGTVGLTNFGNQAADMEVTRYVLGNVNKADHGATVEMINVFEDNSYLSSSGSGPWWTSYSWPDWWRQFNGIGRIVWKFKLDPGKSLDLSYSWNYYTR